MLTHTTDHAARAFARLLEQLKTVDGWQKFLAVFTTQVQALEDAFWDLNTLQLLNGVGYQLDVLGKILAEPRQGFGDADYLERLKAKIVVLRSSGAAPDLIRIYKLLLPDNVIKFTLLSRAAFILDIGTINIDFGGIYQRFLHDAKSAGIDAQLVFSGASDDATFTFDSGTTLSANALAGVTSLSLEQPANIFNGSLVCIEPATVHPELRVMVSPSTLDVATGFAHNNGAAVAALAVPGTFGKTTASTVGAAVSLTFAAGHPFVAGQSITIDPFQSTQEKPRLISAVTPTTITFAPACAFSHSSGTYVIPESHQGWSDEANPIVGGKLSGAIS